MYRTFPLLSLASLALLLSACSPVVRIEAPEKPIEINMTVNIKHEIMIKVEKDVKKLSEPERGVFKAIPF